MRLNPVISPSLVVGLAHWGGEARRERDLMVCVERLPREKPASWGKESTAR